MPNWKEETKLTYDKYAEKFEELTKDLLEKYLLDESLLFIKNLQGKKILDLGSGPGRDSLFFKNKGLKPICIDISEKMIELCKKKGLEAHKMDIEDLKFDDNSFDGIWANASLLHLPKNRINPVLLKIKNLLKENGIFFISMIKKGVSEGLHENVHHYPGNKRYFSLFNEKELENLLTPNFHIIYKFVKSPDKFRVFINYLCRVKK